MGDTIKIKEDTAITMSFYFADDDQGNLVDNWRETQPLNGREVKYYDGTLAKDPTAEVAVTVTEKKSKAEAKVAFGMEPVSVENPLTGDVSTVMQPVQKILLCFTGSDLCMFQ